jgi:hypothetical protein
MNTMSYLSYLCVFPSVVFMSYLPYLCVFPSVVFMSYLSYLCVFPSVVFMSYLPYLCVFPSVVFMSYLSSPPSNIYYNSVIKCNPLNIQYPTEGLGYIASSSEKDNVASFSVMAKNDNVISIFVVYHKGYFNITNHHL